MDKTAEIVAQLRKDAKEYHHQFGLLNYIENKGLRKLLRPFIEKMEAENKALKVTNDRVCVECGYACHMLDIPFIQGKCPSCKGTEFKEVTYVERLESELKNLRKGVIAEMDEHSNLLSKHNEIRAKLDKVMTAHNNSIDLQLKIYENLESDRDEWKEVAKANHDEMEKYTHGVNNAVVLFKHILKNNFTVGELDKNSIQDIEEYIKGVEDEAITKANHDELEKLRKELDREKIGTASMRSHFQAYKAGYEHVISELQAKINSFGESSSDLKAKFIGEYSWKDELTAYGIDDMEDGETYLENRRVPWTLQKQIFKDMCEYVRNRKDEDIRP